VKFLLKNSAALSERSDLSYPRDRAAIRALLSSLQQEFCAYSEKRFENLDAVEVEHFDPRLKETPSDSIFNWHAVVRVVNQRRPRKIEKHLPLPDPNDPGLFQRFVYENGEFCPRDEDDLEAKNLLKWLGINLPEVDRLRDLQECLGDDGLRNQLLKHPANQSFPTAVEAELGIPIFEWLDVRRQ
jgi:hypothetical protein